jgi:hypothetical protein
MPDDTKVGHIERGEHVCQPGNTTARKEPHLQASSTASSKQAAVDVVLKRRDGQCLQDVMIQTAWPAAILAGGKQGDSTLQLQLHSMPKQ